MTLSSVLDSWPPTLTLDQAAAVLATDELDVLQLVSQGALRLLADGVPTDDVRTLLRELERAGRG